MSSPQPADRPVSRGTWSRLLGRLPLFAALDEDDLLALAGVAVLEEVPAGRALWREGDVGSRYVLILRGQLEATREGTMGRPEVVGRLGPGSALGEAALLLGSPHDVTVTALSPARLLTITRAAFQALLEQRPGISRGIRPREDICIALETPRFAWQEEGERVTRLERRHPWAFLRSLLGPLLFALFATAAITYVQAGWQFSFGVVVGSMAWVTWQWLEWRNDLLVLTTRRVSHTERRLPFYTRQESANLERVQDVTIERHGIPAALFGFGHLTVQTAGATGQIYFTFCPHPDGMKDDVLRGVRRQASLQRATQRHRLERQLREQFGYEELGPQVEAASPATTSALAVPAHPMDEAAMRLSQMITGGFPALRSQQGDVIVWRKHWAVLLGAMIWPVGVALMLGTLPALLDLSPERGLYLGASAVLFFWLWWQWENWRNDLYVLTQDRIMELRRLPFGLRSTQREGHLLNIQNVTYEVPGLFASLLNYGHVIIETAGQVGNFQFAAVYDPAGIQADVFRYVDACRNEREARQRYAQSQEFTDLLAAYESMRRSQHAAGSAPEGGSSPS